MAKPRRLHVLAGVLLIWGCAHIDAPARAPSDATRRLDVQGHRGARALLPENTLPAFALALDLGVSTLELDLAMTADGVLVVAHDSWIDPRICRAPGDESIEGDRGPLIRDLTVAEVQDYDCGSQNPDPVRFPAPPRENRPGTPMPRLSQVFELVRSRASDVRFNIEIKTRPDRDWTRPLPEFVAAVVESVSEADLISRTTIQCFDWRVLARVKQVEPRLRTSALVEPDTLDPRWLGGLDPVEFPDFLSLLESAEGIDDFSPYWKQLLAGEDFLGHDIAEYQSAGYRVLPWTVNDLPTMRRLIELGVDGIITDHPGLLLEAAALSGVAVGHPVD